MNVLHLIENLRGGGANRGVFAAAKYSGRLYGHKHVIMTIRADSLAASDETLVAARANGLYPIVGFEKEDFHREVERADVVLLHWWGSPYLWNLRYQNMLPCRLATVYHIAGTVGADLNENIVTPTELDWPDINVAASMHTFDVVFANLPPERKAFVLGGGGGDFERFTGSRDPIPHDGFRIGITCSMAYNKLYRRWLHMNLAARIPAMFRACGDGRHLKYIQQEANELAPGRFVFCGFLAGDAYGHEIGTWDAMGYPTIRDAAPVGLMEAMWFGVPPIVFAHTASARMVVDGETGLLAHSEQEYIAGLEYLYHCPERRLEMGQNAREYASSHFGAQNNAPVFEELLQRLAALPKRRHYSQTQKREEGIP